MSVPTPEDLRWDEPQRARRCIVVADVVESVRLMQADEAGVIDRWRRFVHEVRTQVLPARGGRLVKSLGDGLLLEFVQILPAAHAAFDLQAAIQRFNQGHEPAAWLRLRVGANVADVVVDADDLFGHGVNLAARLATLAGPGETVVSAAFRDGLTDSLDAAVEDLGECFVKHLDQPLRAFRIEPPRAPPRLRERTHAPPAPLRPTVAVIPFDTRGSEAEEAVVGDALADEIIAALSRTQAQNVVSRLSTAVFKQRLADPAQVAATLGADYLLSGNVWVAGRQLRLMVELSEAASGRVVWADRLLGDLAGLWAADDPLVPTVVTQVSGAILQHELRRAELHALPNLRSYSLMLGAIALMHRSSAAEFERAQRMLEHLVERDQRHPRPHAWLANWYALRVTQSRSGDPAADTRRAFDSAQRALDRDPQCALALAVDGVLHLNLHKDFATARQRLDAALQSNPNESLAWLFQGILHAFAGEGEPAEQASERALALTPVDPMRHYYDSLAATAALGAQHYPRAIELAQASLRANRMHPSTYRTLAIAQALDGQVEPARQTVARLTDLVPGYTVGQFRAASGFSAGPLGSVFADALHAAGLLE